MNIITHNTKPVFFEDFINNFFGSNIYNDIPPYNIIETDKEFLIEFSVPGFSKKDFSIEVEENNLKVSKLSLENDKLENKFYKRLDKSVLMSIFASRKAIKSSNWKKSSKLSLNIGSSRGATELFEKYHKDFLNNKSSKLSPISSPNTSLGNISTWVAYDIGFKGFSFSKVG